MRYANYLIQKQYFDAGITNQIRIESGSGSTNPHSAIVQLQLGAVFTSENERDAILDDNRVTTTNSTPAPAPGPTPTPAGPYFTWTQQASAPAQAYFELMVTSDFTTQITTRSSEISPQGPYISTDGGQTWSLKNTGMVFLTNGTSYTIDVYLAKSNGQIMYAANRRSFVSVVTSTYDKLYKSVDGGNNWTAISPVGADSTWQSIACSYDGSVVIAGNSNGTGEYNGKLILSTDGGANWSILTVAGAATGQWAELAISSNGAIIYARNAGLSRLYRSTDTGATWNITATASVVLGIACSADGSVVLVGTNVPSSGAGLYVSTNGGVTLTQVTGPPAGTYNAVAVSDDGKTMAAVRDSVSSKIYVSVDSGSTWYEETGSTASASYISLAINSDGTRIIAATINTRPWIGIR